MCDLRDTLLDELGLTPGSLQQPLPGDLEAVISTLQCARPGAEPAFALSALQAYSVLVSEAIVGTPGEQAHEELASEAIVGTPGEQAHEELGGYGAHAAVKLREEHYERQKLLLLCGEAHRLYTALTSRRTLVKSGDEHVCSNACTLTNLKFRVFALEGSRHADRLHVCLGAGKCLAPAGFHGHARGAYNRVLFVCAETNAVHLCTADTCTTATVDADTFMCCALTGNVHSKSQTILSHGWVEDEWRKGVDQRIKPVAAHVEGQKLACSVGKLVRLYQVDANDSRLAGFKAVLVQKVQVGIRQLMPGSDARAASERRIQLDASYRFFEKAEKYIRLCKAAKVQINMPRLHSIVRMASEGSSGGPTACVLEMDACFVQRISSAYASTAVDFMCQLGKYSSFDPDEYSAADMACTILYMQRNNFTINGTNLVVADPLLAALPSAAHLHHFGYDRNMFTKIKNHLQYCIIDAIDGGVDASVFAIAMISVTDTLDTLD